MPPRLRLRGFETTIVSNQSTLFERKTSICFFCSFSRAFSPSATKPTRRLKRRPSPSTIPRRHESNATGTWIDTRDDKSSPSIEPRRELESILVELQKLAANHVNISRLQLALNGLRQKPGNETIRVAILGLTSGPEASRTAKEVLKLLLADPLKDAEPWEQEVEQHDLAHPMIVRVGTTENQRPRDGDISVVDKESLLREVNVSSATLNGHNLELLLMKMNPFVSAQEATGALQGFEDLVLVPPVDIPISDDGRHSVLTAPVHRALIVADGILGAASVVSMPTLESQEIINAAVNLPDYKPSDTPVLPFTPIDVGTAGVGLGLVRKNLGDAIEFEHLWFQSNMPKLVEWLKADILTTPENTTKPPVKYLIASLLRNTTATIEREEARQLGTPLSSVEEISTSTVTSLQRSLESWAESAHGELQQQLDIAFSSKRWRKLGWWKLFWRVDDVGMLTNDILTQRFLPEAERNAIFLSGRMKEAGIPPIGTDATAPSSSPSSSRTLYSSWPGNIPAARRYLQSDTIPALQALAQKLVFQTLSTSGLTTALGTLIYVGTLMTTLYEAGAVAALGVVWSMRRMQRHWEKAREFWEGEVREEGRKAVRGVEGAIGDALSRRARVTKESRPGEGQAELDNAKALVQRAEELLQRLQ